MNIKYQKFLWQEMLSFYKNPHLSNDIIRKLEISRGIFQHVQKSVIIRFLY